MKWISCKKRVPDTTEDVLCWNGEYMQVSCYFFCDAWKKWVWESRDSTKNLGQVTHWKPLPKPPK
jgi:hypothetical protein